MQYLVFAGVLPPGDVEASGRPVHNTRVIARDYTLTVMRVSYNHFLIRKQTNTCGKISAKVDVCLIEGVNVRTLY